MIENSSSLRSPRLRGELSDLFPLVASGSPEREFTTETQRSQRQMIFSPELFSLRSPRLRGALSDPFPLVASGRAYSTMNFSVNRTKSRARVSCSCSLSSDLSRACRASCNHGSDRFPPSRQFSDISFSTFAPGRLWGERISSPNSSLRVLCASAVRSISFIGLSPIAAPIFSYSSPCPLSLALTRRRATGAPMLSGPPTREQTR